MTIAELRQKLLLAPQDYKVFISSDPEGNGFGSLDPETMVGGSDDDKVIVLYPSEMYTDDEIMPIEMEKILKELA